MTAVSYLSVLAAVTCLAAVLVSGLALVTVGIDSVVERRYARLGAVIALTILLVTTFIWVGITWG